MEGPRPVGGLKQSPGSASLVLKHHSSVAECLKRGVNASVRGRGAGFSSRCVQPRSGCAAGDQLCLGARWLPAIYGQQVWSHHRLQQPLHQHHGGFPWRHPSLTSRLHINTQSTPPTTSTATHSATHPSVERLGVLQRSASLVTSQLPLKHISSEAHKWD